jgi:uncharacterized NAD-dependent epimerase/dehydratase family protein
VPVTAHAKSRSRSYGTKRCAIKGVSTFDDFERTHASNCTSVAIHLETTRRGVFAIGDVRAKSVKRVAAAVGEGAQVVAAIHAFLAADRLNLPVDAPIPVQSH